jgi:hypothetical protein
MNESNDQAAADRLLYQFKVLSASIDWYGLRLHNLRAKQASDDTVQGQLAIKKQVDFLERRLKMEEDLHVKLSEQAKKILG